MLSLAEFTQLAKDNSKDGRVNLVAALTDLFVSADDQQAEQVSLIFGDIVLCILGQLEADARQDLANRVGAHNAAPHNLLLELAQDEIEVAQTVLENSKVLSADDLARVASFGSMEHLRVLAGREEVDEQVAKVIVVRGDDAVLAKVTENPGANFDESTFLRLVDRSRLYQAIQEALLTRSDLPPEAARMLLPLLSKEVAARIKADGPDSPLAKAMADKAAEDEADRAKRAEAAREKADKLISDVKAGKAKIDDVVQNFARGDKAEELGCLLASMGELPLSSVKNLVYGKSDKPLVIICKAVDVGPEAFKSILTMRARRLGLSGTALNEAILRYTNFSKDAALRSLAAIRESVEQPNKPQDPGAPAKSNIAFGVRR